VSRDVIRLNSNVQSVRRHFIQCTNQGSNAWTVHPNITKMIWSSQCINPEKGFELQKDSSAKPNRLGYYVLTVQECKELLDQRRY